MSQIVIYQAPDGHVKLDVNLVEETVWLTLNQMAELFCRDKSVISRHLTHIFKTDELYRKEVVANYATTAADGKNYKVNYYNLDVIISVGYRVNSKQGIAFRKWATHVLKEHLIKGYTLYANQIAKRGFSEIEQAVTLLQTTIQNNALERDISVEAIDLILSYAKTWHLLLAYDEERLTLKEKGREPKGLLVYEDAVKAICALKKDLGHRGEATELFARERGEGLKGILMAIEQTFAGENLYKTVEEKAAHLLYFIIKDHPFVDGNKRIGSFLFVVYLNLQSVSSKINENGLVALALLVAESAPSQKEIMIKLIVNLLGD